MTRSKVTASLLESIRTRRVRAGVIGLGYVGLPLAVEFAQAGYTTTGLDLDATKVRAINDGRSYIDAAAEDVAKRLRPGMLVILESTTYPGTTDELVLPILERGGLRGGKDFFLAFSPERIDPANPTFGTHNVPKVVGGLTEDCSVLAAALYQAAI